jgi:hypothetical protein
LSDRDARDEWLDQCQGYYRDRYPGPMRHKVKAILPTDRQRLRALMDIIIEDADAWKRSVKVPGVDAVQAAKRELYQRYPEFQDTAVDGDAVLLLDDASPIRDELVARGFQAMMDAVKHGRNPATDEAVTSVLQELGYEVEA